MKTASLVIMIFLTNIVFAQSKATTIYLIRHAEKADASANTDLSLLGKQRAKHWAKYLIGKKVAAVYSSDYNRTQQTAEPIAKQAGTEVIKYNPRELDLKKLAADNPGKVIVVVGHSNTIPGYVNAALGTKKYEDIAETEFGTIFEVVIENGVVTVKDTVVPFQVVE
ncbi:MAG: SixA phosphatase family protein [Flavobacterium sp.]